MKQNLIIRASAGTGKTFSLATRFIRLMLFQGVSPERIVGLTFSRAAAQEIYMKLLERLWTAALSEAGAAHEGAVLLQGLGADDRAAVQARFPAWSPQLFATVLRRVIDTQHYGAISTLDSFILRIVKSFPLEMGFQNAVEVLDAFGEKRALADAQSSKFDAEDSTGTLAADFKLATHGRFVRSAVRALGRALAGWRDFLLAHPDSGSWTPESVCTALGVPPRATAKLPTDILPVTGKRGDPFGAIAAAYGSFDGEGSLFPENKGGELMRYLARHPDETDYEYPTKTGSRRISCTPEVADLIRAVVRDMLNAKLRRQAEVVCAKLRLCRAIESEYDATTRRRGQLTFSDFTDCQAVAEGDSEAALRLENLQFRFDTRFDHWALDEFQDTSELQWRCLRRLVKEAAQPDADRSVMAVGDLKQSIYTWRGGNDAPFKEMMDDWPEFRGEAGEIVPNDISYRYGKNTAEFVNRVFGPGNIASGGALPEDRASAVARWLEEDCWMTHRADAKDGVERAGDFVEVIAVPPVEEAPSDETSDEDGADDDSGGAALRKLAPGLCACVADLWARHEAAKSTDTVGILVRNNTDGRALAERLRSWGEKGLPVVWEGADGVLDAPVVRAVLELLKLAEHPQDTFAWTTVNRLFPVRELVFPEAAGADAVSRCVSEMLTKLGLARALREIANRLLASPARPDARSVLRLEALVREGVNYERRKDASKGMLHFADYLAATAGRETSASPHVIRILTIHRSKGLTLDHVVVPVLETSRSESIVKPSVRKGGPLTGEGWAVDRLPEDEAMLNDRLAEAWRRAADERVLGELRVNYVALTRARKSTHVFLCDEPPGSGVLFRDVLTRPFADESSERTSPYGRLVCALGQMPDFGVKASKPEARSAWTHVPGRLVVSKRTPSLPAGGAFGGGSFAVGAMFARGRLSAAEKGTSAHERYARIEWIDPAAPRDETEARIAGSYWKSAFVRTEATTALWRERSYELYENGVWETGQFDRVVFSESGGTRSATIYDFKTNALRPDETPAAFAARMGRAYASQMAAYRHALARLTGLSPDRIATSLLLEATGEELVV